MVKKFYSLSHADDAGRKTQETSIQNNQFDGARTNRRTDTLGIPNKDNKTDNATVNQHSNRFPDESSSEVEGIKHKISNETSNSIKMDKTVSDETSDNSQRGNSDVTNSPVQEDTTDISIVSKDESDRMQNSMSFEIPGSKQDVEVTLNNDNKETKDDTNSSKGKSDRIEMDVSVNSGINGDVNLNFPKDDTTDLTFLPSKKETEKNGDKGKLPDISLLQMFRFADNWDKLLIVIGTLASVVTGLAIPVNLLVYGRVATGFIYYTILQDSLSNDGNSTVNMPFNPDKYDELYEFVREHALYFCLIGVGVIVSTFIQYSCWDVAQERQMRTIRKMFYKAVIHRDIAWFDLHHGGELGTVFSESMLQVSGAIGKDVSVTVQWTVTFIGCNTLALIKGWKVALACIAFSPLLIITGSILTRLLRSITQKESESYAKAGEVVEEVLGAIKTVMAFNGQEKECKRYDENLQEGGSSSMKKGIVMGLGSGIVWLIMYFVFATAFGYGIKLMGNREPGFEPGSVLLIFIGVLMGSMSLGQAFPFLESLANGKVAAAKIFHIIEQKTIIDSSSPDGDRPAKIIGRLDLQDVSFTYPARPEVQVLKNFSISVDPGKTVALVGHSGCGKSTVVQLVERFYDTNAGEVLLDGRNIKDLNVAWHREQIGLVSQEPVLFATTIKENIKHGNEDITDEQIVAAAKEANIHEFVSELPEGYDTLVGYQGTQLSGGQKQRIAIARALVRNPTILLLDEATSALDNESEAIVQKALEKAQEGRTTIIIAHRLSTMKNADNIIVMEEGSVVEQGTHNELMERKGIYHQLVKHQMHQDTEDEVVVELEHDIMDSNEVKHRVRTPVPTRKAQKSERRTSFSSKKSNVKEEEENEEILPKFSMKRILRLNSPEWLSITVGCLLSIVSGSLQPATAIILSEFLDIFTRSKEDQESATRTLIGIIMGIGIINTIVRLLVSVSFANAGYKLTMRFRSLTFKSCLRQDMSFFDDAKNAVGILSTRLANDAALVQGATGTKIGAVLDSIATLLAALTVGFLSSWKLALVVLAFLPFLVGMGLAQGKLTMGLAKKNKGALEQAGQICTETVENIRVVASSTQENTFKKKYNKLIDDLCSKTIRRSFPGSLLMAFSASVLSFGYAATFTYGAYLVQYDGLRFNMVFRVFAAISFGGMHIGRTSVLTPDFTKAKVAAARLFLLMDTEPKVDVSKPEGKVVDNFDGSLEFQSVSFQYPSRPDVTVLHDISLTASPGETVALVGASGCGKSTMVSLLERFYDPDTGSVMASSEDISSLNLKWLRSQIGLVSQEPVLFDCSLADNIAYGDNDNIVPMDKILDVARSANIHDFITSLPEGYDTNVGSKGTQLSGGQKQRIAIARALVSNPKILLLDEATSALDSKSEKIVQEALDHARKGRTCIVIAHRLSTIQNANKIAIIHKGEVVEQGTHSELLAKKGIYHKLIHQHKQ